MAHNFQQWSVDDVSKWLESLHLHSLIPIFEGNSISGADLPLIDDAYMRESLRITKPGEITVLRGAISNLTEQAGPPSTRGPNKVQNRRVSAPLRERSGSFDKQKTYPQTKTYPQVARNLNPTTMPRNFTVSGGERELVGGATREPRLKKGASAGEVLDDKCRYSGWIRKQGGGYKNWRRRYLVLRLGCLYYFANETAKEPKGCFTLAGYRTEICSDQEILKKQKWTLKVEPFSGALRTYYLSVGAKRELYAWKQAIDEEIVACARRPRPNDHGMSGGGGGGGGMVGEMGEVGEVAEGSSDEAEEGDDDEPIYDQPDEDEDGIYDRPDEGEEDDPYSEITEKVPGARLPSPSSTTNLPSTLPAGGRGAPLAVKSFKGINDWELAPEHRVLGGKGGAPTVPMRSPVSLGLDQKQAPPQPVVGRGGGGGEEVFEDTYLPIIGSGSVDSTPLSADRNKLYSPPHHPGTSIPELDRDYEDDKALEGEDYGGDDNDTYYIMIRKPEELMPPSCLFNNLDRSEADRLLRAKAVNGTYLIRAGNHAGSEKVLSVWHDDRCRHYKLFKDENSQYSLTQGRTFSTIPELLQNYWQSDYLPRSEFHLSEPFYPDH